MSQLNRLVSRSSSAIVIDSPLSNSLTPMIAAINGGHASIVRRLIELGSNVNASGGAGKSTPLHISCQRGHLEITEILVRAGADITACDASGATPADRARESQQNVILKFLNELQMKALLGAGGSNSPTIERAATGSLRPLLNSLIATVSKIEENMEKHFAESSAKMEVLEKRLADLEASPGSTRIVKANGDKLDEILRRLRALQMDAAKEERGHEPALSYTQGQLHATQGQPSIDHFKSTSGSTLSSTLSSTSNARASRDGKDGDDLSSPTRRRRGSGVAVLLSSFDDL